MLVFRQDLAHAGEAYETGNIRLHFFLDPVGHHRTPNTTGQLSRTMRTLFAGADDTTPQDVERAVLSAYNEPITAQRHEYYVRRLSVQAVERISGLYYIPANTAAT